MTIFQPPYIMYHILVDEQSLSGVNQNRGIKLSLIHILYRHSNRKRVWKKQKYSELLEISVIKAATKRNGEIRA